MWLEQLHKLHIIDAAANAMGHFIQKYSTVTSQSTSILCALSTQAIKNGHTCLDCKNIILQFPELSQLPELLTYIDLDYVLEHPLIGLNSLHENTLFTFASPYLFTNKLFALETKLIHQIASRLNSDPISDPSSTILQLAALCFSKPLSILSGGPGTGKTTVFAQAIPYWIQQFQSAYQKNPRIILCAPTGKAAARMSESWLLQNQNTVVENNTPLDTGLPLQAFTIHRLLGINPLSRQAHFNQANHLAVDLLIIDEASMLDLPLFVKLLEACPMNAHILLIGDQQQLPAIEAGDILGSLLHTESEHWFFKNLQNAHLHLSHNFRQQDKPGLASIATDCLNQHADDVINKLRANEYANVSWSANTHENHLSLIHYATCKYKEMINCTNVEQALVNIHTFVILTAVRDGPSGCVAINNEIMRLVNVQLQSYYHGQILLITENANHLNLANGDIVVIWQKGQSLMAYFNFNSVTLSIELDNLPRNEPAYALTIHKAQGSEYDEVVMVLPTYESPILNKSLIYTGITRAKNRLQIFANPESLIFSLDNTSKRVNGLRLLAEILMQDEI